MIEIPETCDNALCQSHQVELAQRIKAGHWTFINWYEVFGHHKWTYHKNTGLFESFWGWEFCVDHYTHFKVLFLLDVLRRYDKLPSWAE
jgi:hypothetical protein